jgi:hypothetical protein
LRGAVAQSPAGIGPAMPEPSTWLLTAWERGNPATRLDDRHAGGEAWSAGNEVRPLVHGAAYFADLAEVRKLRAGDLLLFTDWCADADERLEVTAASADPDKALPSISPESGAPKPEESPQGKPEDVR